MIDHHRLIAVCALFAALAVPGAHTAESADVRSFDVVVVGGTPGGVTSAIAAARGGCTVVLLDRTRHIGGLPANGLGATDIHTRGATQGLFMEFIERNRRHYAQTYGEDSRQYQQCSGGYRFEPSVAESTFAAMLAEQGDKITVLKRRQFDAAKENVTLLDGAVRQITVLNRDDGKQERYAGKVFIDATYEGDLAAACGAPFRLGREGFDETREPMSGKIYKRWGERKLGEGSTQQADDAVQAYNFRLCLTQNRQNMVPIAKPAEYNRDEYAALIDDVKLNRATGVHRGEKDYDGIGRIVNMVTIPNDKTDANNQHLAFISTDLPEENWPWPTASWQWRDRYAQRLQDYTLGLLWFAQHDAALPEEFRRRCLAWGLAKDEYTDNGNFPRQVYVREGRRIEGEHLFTAHDAGLARASKRPPVYATSITASHYYLDSHAVRKREPGRVHLDGFFSHPTFPYTVPYGVIVPRKVDGLLTPVPVSGTHVGFSTLRMEPCWMAMGQAAGTAACQSIRDRVPPRRLNVWKIQRALLEQNAMLIYFKDLEPTEAHFAAAQFFAVRGFFGREGWEARLGEPVGEDDARRWIAAADIGKPRTYAPGKTTRGELLAALFKSVQALPDDKINAIRCPR